MGRNIHSSKPSTLAGRRAVTWISAATVRAQTSAPIVYAVPIEGIIDLGLAPFLARTIGEAKEAGASAVLLEINTIGGRVDAAVAMRDTLLNSPVRTIAFVNQRAISAGALIALASETLVMTEGGTIGAAAPVVGGAGESNPADEKSVSYVRKEFRATAEVRKRPPEYTAVRKPQPARKPGSSRRHPASQITSCIPKAPRPAPRHCAENATGSLSGEQSTGLARVGLAALSDSAHQGVNGKRDNEHKN